MAKQTHTHKLKRHTYKKTGNSIFFCVLPDCHYKIDAPLALGKRTLCHVCDTEFIMHEQSLKLVRPHCIDCGKVRVKDADGKNRYVKKVTNRILTGIAAESNKDLRSRLDNVVSPDTEEDI